LPCEFCISTVLIIFAHPKDQYGNHKQHLNMHAQILPIYMPFWLTRLCINSIYCIVAKTRFQAFSLAENGIIPFIGIFFLRTIHMHKILRRTFATEVSVRGKFICKERDM